MDALLAIHEGEVVVSPAPAKARPASGLDWPGRAEGLTNRESEILALITQGKSNEDVAALTFLSKNSIKSYIRSAYRKIGAPAARKQCCGASTTASNPTTAASTTGATAPSHDSSKRRGLKPLALRQTGRTRVR